MIDPEVCMPLTSDQQDEVWDRWGRGEPSRLIARALRCSPAVVRRHLAVHGGVRPAARRRSDRHLSVGEREEISRGIPTGASSRTIALLIGRSASTVSREIARNGGRVAYRAALAEVDAWERARRPKVSKLAGSPALLAVVRSRLELDWSPQQIAAWLPRTHPTDSSIRVSHETIYRSIYISGRNDLGPHAARHLRSGRAIRQARRVKQGHGRGVLRNMTSIHTRPAAVTDRQEVGHWEGDLVMGTRPSAVATLVERSTRFVRIVPLPDGYRADAVRHAIAADLRQIPPALRKSLTWDRGREMAFHQELADETGTSVYFCDLRSPWQRGANENTNRLLRQYLPKTDDLRRFSLRDLDEIAAHINHRPRRVLDWATAAELFLPQVRAAAVL